MPKTINCTNENHRRPEGLAAQELPYV